MTEKIKNIWKNDKKSGDGFYYKIEFESGLSASAFNDKDIAYITENLEAGDMCKVGIVKKGQWNNVTDIEKVIDVQGDVAEPSKPKPTYRKPGSDDGRDWSMCLAYAKDILCVMITVKGDAKGLGADDVLVMTDKFYNSFPSRK